MQNTKHVVSMESGLEIEMAGKKLPLEGIIPPMVTPLSQRDVLDCAGLERLVEHLISGGIHGLFVLGTTGEAPSLCHRVRAELVERVCDQVGDRLPVLVGITDTSFGESVEMAEAAADNGAVGVVAAAPYYFPAGQPELLEYIERLAAEVPLPLYLYNMPGCTKVSFDPETVRVAAAIPGIVALKDSSGDLDYFRRVRDAVADFADFRLLIGPEEMLPQAMALGASGGVTGGANMFPQLYVGLYDAIKANDAERIRTLHARVMKISSTIYEVGRFDSRVIKGIKAVLSCLGICDDYMADPFQRFRPEQRCRIQEYMHELNLLDSCPAAS